MLVPVLPPIMGVLFLPVFLAVSLVGLIVRVVCQFLSLPEVLSGPLTNLTATVALVFYSGIGMKKTMAMGTSDLVVHGFPPA